MNDQLSRYLFTAFQDARIPENVTAMVEDNVAKTREVYDKLSTVAKDSAKVIENVVGVSQAGVKTIGEVLLHNTEQNAIAVLDAAQAIARAKTVPELMQLQSNFIQQQFALAAAQSQELIELSTKVAQQTFQSVNVASIGELMKFR